MEKYMKKILLLLFSVMLSFNSYGETIICSGEAELWYKI